MRASRYYSTFMLLAAARCGGAEPASPSTSNAPIQITIDAAKTGPPINPFIYGQFIEHLGRCIYGGIWAEMLEDRKFYFPITDEYHPYRDLKDSEVSRSSARRRGKSIGPAGSRDDGRKTTRSSASTRRRSPPAAASARTIWASSPARSMSATSGSARPRAQSNVRSLARLGRRQRRIANRSTIGGSSRRVHALSVQVHRRREHRSRPAARSKSPTRPASSAPSR